MRLAGLVPLGLGLCFSHVCQAAGPIVCDELLIHAEARRARVWRYSWTGITTLAGVALGEAQLLTQPTGLPHGCTLACPTLAPRFVALRATAGQLNGGVLSLAGAF